MKEVYSTNNEVELQMLVGLLESCNIQTNVRAGGAGDYFRVKGSDVMIYKSVLVRDEDWEKAVKIAKDNGFEKKKQTVKRGKGEVWLGRILLVIFVAIFLANVYMAVADYL